MATSGVDFSSQELTLIDSGIQSLQDLPLRSHLQVLNLHGNYIQRLENLEQLTRLRHLDLSSNQVRRMEGLSHLAALRTLNLSCNLITQVQGLEALRCLVRVNLSYNQIEDISGFRALWGQQFSLAQVELYGNKLRTTSHIIQALQGCCKLQQLVLSQDGSGNPVCHQQGYHSDIMAGLPQLRTLDGRDRSGREVVSADVLADIPGLDEYVEYLLSSTSTETMATANLVTPKIDQALQSFRQRAAALVAVDTSTALSSTETDMTAPPFPRAARSPQAKQQNAYREQESRLESLEAQLQELITAQQERPEASLSAAGGRGPPGRGPPGRGARARARKETDGTDESDGAQSQRSFPAGLGSRRGGAAASASRRGSRGGRTGRSKDRSLGDRVSSAGDAGRESSGERKTAGTTTRRKAGSRTTPLRTAPSPSRSESTPSSGGPGPSPLPARPATDLQFRADIENTYVQLMKELETERERRWKAEEAAKKLVEHMKHFQSRAREDSDMRDTAVEATAHLKRALANEREVKLRLQGEVDSLKERVSELTEQLEGTTGQLEEQRAAMRQMEETVSGQERDRFRQHAHELKKLQEAQTRAAVVTRELEVERQAVEKHKAQVQQLQELLASREQEHREELKRRYTLDSKELQAVIQKEVSAAQATHRLELQAQTEKVDLLSRQYSELENEFRLALQIEANRFSELQEEFERVNEENKRNRAALEAAQKKDENSSSMLTELTALVKEQKGRILELSRAKQEQGAEHKERIYTLEAHAEEARKRMVQLELLKKEKSRLEAQVQAQESVIEGLKAERKLWGQELAQQGVSLAQDRGRLESRLEMFLQENASLKKQLERETDAVRIKSKIIDDQTETIRKLKEGLLERDEEVRRAREEALASQRDLEEQLADERATVQEHTETIERLQARKEELKQQLATLQEEVQESKKAHSALNSKWREKAELIGQLERQVEGMRTSWEAKERRLTQERDRALKAADLAIEKLRQADEGFRKQLEAKEAAHGQELADLEAASQQQLQQAQLRVVQVEGEMRELLQETDAAKRAMEAKVKRLTHALGDLQSDLA